MRALVIEDSDTYAQYLCYMLGKVGCETVHAVSLSGALAVLHEDVFDFIFLDVWLRGSNVNVLQSMQAVMAAKQSARLVVMSAEAGLLPKDEMVFGEVHFVAKDALDIMYLATLLHNTVTDAP